MPAGSGPTFTTSAANGLPSGSTGTVTAAIGPCQASASVPLGGAVLTGTYGDADSRGNETPLQVYQYIDPNRVYTLRINGPYTFTMTSSSPSIKFYQQGNTASLSFGGSTIPSVQILVTATNAPCGSTTGSFSFLPMPGRLMAGPNPASETLTVTQGTPASAAAPNSLAKMSAAPFEATLYDSFGRQVKTQRSANGQAVLDVRDLPNGLYVLRSGTGKEAAVEHIQVKH